MDSHWNPDLSLSFESGRRFAPWIYSVSLGWLLLRSHRLHTPTDSWPTSVELMFQDIDAVQSRGSYERPSIGLRQRVHRCRSTTTTPAARSCNPRWVRLSNTIAP